jgi:phosphoribosylformylglycinamidine synthase
LSTPATDLDSQHRIDMLELPGQSALSDFRLEKLLRSLQTQDDRVKSVSARFSYFVAVTATLSAQQQQHLDALLLSGDKPGKLSKGAKTIYVVPRPGTISPWSIVSSAVSATASSLRAKSAMTRFMRSVRCCSIE